MARMRAVNVDTDVRVCIRINYVILCILCSSAIKSVSKEGHKYSDGEQVDKTRPSEKRKAAADVRSLFRTSIAI